MKPRASHGSGQFLPSQLARLGERVVFEPGALVFHPESIEIGDDVYVGHQAILKGYYRNRMIVGSGTWIGQQAFLHSAGGLTIGRNVASGRASGSSRPRTRRAAGARRYSTARSRWRRS